MENTYEFCLQIFDELENNHSLILDKIKQLPRSGKSIRIDKYNLNLPKQSLYSHIISLAFIVDAIIDLFGYDFDKKMLAEMCIFHDISEIIIGDIPEFTSKELMGDMFSDKINKQELENKANLFLKQILSKNLSKSFENIVCIFQEKPIEYLDIINFFEMIDKIEPIISVWSYIYFYKDKIDIDGFLTAMLDFFENPKVINYAINDYFKDLIRFLQNKENAKQYYIQGNLLFGNLNSSKEFLSTIIEKNKFYFID